MTLKGPNKHSERIASEEEFRYSPVVTRQKSVGSVRLTGYEDAQSNELFSKTPEGFYEAISVLEDENEGMNQTHSLLINSLYSSHFLPLLSTAKQHCNANEKEIISGALQDFGVVKDMVEDYARQCNISVSESFLELYDEAMSGENDLLIKLNQARHSAARCISDLLWKMKHFEEARTVYDEYNELERGLDLPQGFSVKLNNPNTKAFVVSLDFNSTFNIEESYPSVDLAAKAQRTIHAFTRAFRKKFPEKELVLAINTGRPGLYAWGVAESAFSPVKEARKVAVAESGGVILEEGLKSGKMKVAVEKPEMWELLLREIRDEILAGVKNPENVLIEPKSSMLSIKLAEDDKFVLESVEGEEITPDWIRSKVRNAVSKVMPGVPIESKYNPTCGYVDIGNPGQNKFKTLMNYVCEQNNIRPDEVLFLQIGDSSTDILPVENTGKGGENEGADDAYLVAINDCNNSLKKAVRARGNKGMITANKSILAVEALFKGLKNLVK